MWWWNTISICNGKQIHLTGNYLLKKLTEVHSHYRSEIRWTYREPPNHIMKRWPSVMRNYFGWYYIKFCLYISIKLTIQTGGHIWVISMWRWFLINLHFLLFPTFQGIPCYALESFFHINAFLGRGFIVRNVSFWGTPSSSLFFRHLENNKNWYIDFKTG